MTTYEPRRGEEFSSDYVAQQPRAPRRSWTNAILIANTLTFLAITFLSQSLFNPSIEYLVAWGAKEPVHLALGQWWRFVTPIFLHIGLVHFALNSLALKYVGRHIEALVGGGWFVFMYLLTGIVGNIASSLVNVEVGAGASGAIFGLIGVGVVFEWLVEWRNHRAQQTPWRLIPGPFTSMALLNIALALVINFLVGLSDSATIGIDNAAHLGGLFSGMALGLALLCIRANFLMPQRRIIGGLLIAGVLTGALLGAYVVTSTDFIKKKFLRLGEESSEGKIAYSYLTRGLFVDPDDAELHFARGKLFLAHGQIVAALKDFAHGQTLARYREDLAILAEELVAEGRLDEARQLRALVQSSLAP